MPFLLGRLHRTVSSRPGRGPTAHERRVTTGPRPRAPRAQSGRGAVAGRGSSCLAHGQPAPPHALSLIHI
eukprot:6736422-Alexandrium_andersonii.AAC.1